MSSATRLHANRENSLLSTGPVTKNGKSRSAQNATKHGLTSGKVVLPHESEDEYNHFRETLLADRAPATEYEHTLAVVVAETFWRRQRFYRLETTSMALRMESAAEVSPDLANSDEALIDLLTNPIEISKSRLMLRYVTAAERAYSKALSDLEKVQAVRRKAERMNQSPVDRLISDEADSYDQDRADEIAIETYIAKLRAETEKMSQKPAQPLPPAEPPTPQPVASFRTAAPILKSGPSGNA